MEILKQTKIQLSILLFLVFLSNLIIDSSFQIFIPLAVSVASAVLFDLLFLRIRKINLFFPSAAIATGIIIALLTSPTLPLYVFILSSAVAMFAKNFLRFPRHIFNPAALGLLVISLVFGFAVSWWGVSWQILDFSNPLSFLPFLILLSPGLISVYKMRRWRIILSFFFSYFFIGSTFNLQVSAFYLLDPTLIFFSLVMLPEPMTTPNRFFPQAIFGFFVSLLFILTSLGVPYLNIQAGIMQDGQLSTSIDSLILALLIANLLFFRFR